jgi:SEFIR domain
MADKNPKVFISYSHDSREHQDRVLELSNRLRNEGIDCSLDQYEDSPPEGWPKWMDRNVYDSDFVLVVCTEIYYKRVKGKDENGRGIKWESTLFYQQLYNAGAHNTKFIPIIFNDGKFENIPEPLQGATFYNMDDKESFEKLYWRLRGVKAEKPELGKLRELPAKERRTLFFVSGLIDQEQWEKANWKNGMGYLYSQNGDLPPIMVLFFENIEFGKEIFENFIRLVGKEDKSERIRISIVEGEAPNQENGYFVTIGENPKATRELISSTDESEVIEYFATQQRFHRIFVERRSVHLAKFKEEYQKFGHFYIAPGQQLNGDEKGVSYESNYMIFKREIQFREFDGIPEKDDLDSILKSDEVLNHKF